MTTNVALAANGGVASGTNPFGGGAGTDLDITWSNDGGSPLYDGNDNHSYAAITADNLVITFSGTKTIDTVVVWFNNSDGRSTDPGDATTATGTVHATNFTIATWNGSSWDVQSTITSNTLLKRTITFAQVATTKIRFAWTADGGSGLVAVQELQAFEAASYAGSASGTSTAQAIGNVQGVGVGASAGIATSAAVGAAHGDMVASSAGVSAATAVPFGFAVAAASGASTATCSGLTARLGVGSAIGRSRIAGSSINVIKINRALVCEVQEFDGATIAFPDTGFVVPGVEVPVLRDGNGFGSTAYVTPAGKCLYVGGTYSHAGGTVFSDFIGLIDTLVIHSSTHDPFDDEFDESTDNGCVGNAAEALQIDNVGQLLTTSSGTIVGTNKISGNRATILTVTFAPINPRGVIIRGAFSGGRFDLKTGSVIYEIELLHTHVAYDEELEDACAVIDALVAVHAIKFESTGAEIDVLSGRRIANLVSDAASISVGIGIGTEQGFGSAAGTSAARAVARLVETMVDGGDASAEVALARTLELQSEAAVSAVLASKIVHAEESTGAADDAIIGDGTVTQSEESTGEATDTVIGIRRVTVIEESGGIGTNAPAPKKLHVDTVGDSAAASTSVVQGSHQAEELESVAYVEDFLPAPFTGTYPVLWANSKLAAGATWDGLPFNSFIEADGVVYAAGPGGLFELGVDDVASEIEWDLSDQQVAQMKRVRSLYIHAKTATPFTVRVANEQGVFDYPTQEADSKDLTNHRAPIGRGLMARQARVSILHTGSFAAENAGFTPLVSQRRI